MANSKTELKKFWRPRIADQIKDCMKAHPDWFSDSAKDPGCNIINSLTNRIVGEIIAMGKNCSDNVE